jgi:hypothetical protein
MNRKTIASKLHTIQSGISGALNQPEIGTLLATFGYTAEKLAEGKALLDEATRLTALQVNNYGNQYAATDEASKALETAYADYMITLKVIRVAFKGDMDALASFKASGKRNKSLSGWLRDARVMYANLLGNETALATAARFGITKERLQKEQQQLDAVAALYSKQLEKKGEAQQATIDRDKAFDELANWYSDFRAIARIALHEKPQLLEALGIVVKR